MSMEKGEKAKGWTEPELKNIGSKTKARGEKNGNQIGSKRNKKKKKKKWASDLVVILPERSRSLGAYRWRADLWNCKNIVSPLFAVGFHGCSFLGLFQPNLPTHE